VAQRLSFVTINLRARNVNGKDGGGGLVL
jgi:hypothetical protein